MEFILMIIFFVISYLVLRFIFGIDMKKLKSVGENKELDEIVNKYPENIEICKECLNILNNNDVNVVEDKEANTTMYFVMGSKIFIANLNNSFTRIQTIAHECLHSIQNKKILWFNFIFSNIYLIFFVVICVLELFGVLPYKSMFVALLVLMGTIYCFVRNYLENDAMIKAKFLSEKYMKNKSISTEQEIEKVVGKYDELYNLGIRVVNFQLLISTFVKNIIFCLICILR